RLLAAYHSADLFVMPSVHEGFCIPVAEAMAVGVPVIAADAGALPETLASAGLTFAPDDPRDLARQMKRVLESRGQTAQERRQGSGVRGQGSEISGQKTENRRRRTEDRGPAARIAVVAFRYGENFVGGAERSLRTIVDALSQNDCRVEVFTTCTNAEGEWTND